MGLFNKKGPDIDYTLLQKKGIIKKEEDAKLPYKVNAQGLVDLTSMQNESINADTAISDNNSNAGMAANPFGFLDNLGSSSNSLNSASTSESPADLSALKIKIDDVEYKLERLVEKLSLIESKLEAFERKVLG